jgi:hypothetical protein
MADASLTFLDPACSSRAGLGLPPLSGGPLGATLARLKSGLQNSSGGGGISVITSDDINRCQHQYPDW